MSTPRAALAFAALLWAACLASGLALRPLLPVDETRYLAVALEMWQRGDFLVPWRNGVPYHHKPPLLFWSMHAGWAVLGVGEAWARMVAPLFGLASLAACVALARLLHPGRPAVAAMAPLALMAFSYFALFGTLTFFDTLVTFFALVGWIGMVLAARGQEARGWTLVALALGLGILAKGPVQLLHLLPVALLAPLWARAAGGSPSWRRWYAGLGLALLAGAAIGLAWAIPAAISGGEEFARKIFLGQHTGRMVRSFQHARPFWWYAPMLLALLFPALWWLAPWRGLRGGGLGDGGTRFVACACLPVLAAFSAISGKQPHYLLPEFALAAILLARLADRDGYEDRRLDRAVPALGLALAGIGMVALPFLAPRIAQGRPGMELATGLAVAIAGFGLVLLAGAALLLRDRARAAPARLASLAAATAALVVAANLGFLVLAPANDAAPIARVLAAAEAEGRRVGMVGDYESEFHFAGRLREPFADELGDAGAIAWARANPEGVVLRSYGRRAALPADWPAPLHLGPWRGRLVAAWPAALVAGPRGAELMSDPPAR